MNYAPSERTRDVLLVALGVTTGATDVAAFERLGHVFASVITGNLILLGAGAVSGSGSLARFSGIALGAYALGVLVASPGRRENERDNQDQAAWPRSASLALSLEFGLLAVFAVAWELVAGRPGQAMQDVLLAVLAGAMGVQSAAVRRMGQMSTTYLTSTLTGVVESLATRRWPTGQARGVGIILAAVAGAAAGLALVLHAHDWLPVLQLLPLAIVLLAAPDGAGLLRAASSRRIGHRMAYEPKVTVGAGVVLKDGRTGEIVKVSPDRPTETSYDEDMKITVRLGDGQEEVVGPDEIEELTPPSGADPADGA